MFKVNEFLKKINKVFVYTVFLISGQGYTPDLQLLVFRPLKTLFYVCLPVPTTTQSYTHVILVLVKGSRKKKVPLLMARPLRGEGWGGVKGRAIKEKKTFFFIFFLFCCHIKIKIFYFRQLIKLWTYHVKVCR